MKVVRKVISSRPLLGVVCSSLLGIALVALRADCGSAEQRVSLDKIAVGMKRRQVNALLGEPRWRDQLETKRIERLIFPQGIVVLKNDVVFEIRETGQQARAQQVVGTERPRTDPPSLGRREANPESAHFVAPGGPTTPAIQGFLEDVSREAEG